MHRTMIGAALLLLAAGCHDPLHDLIDDTTKYGACFYACNEASKNCFEEYGITSSECQDKARTLCGARPQQVTFLEDGSCYGTVPEWYRTWGPDAFGG